MRKPLLPVKSSHAALVKRSIVHFVVSSALKRSCVHHVGRVVKRHDLRLVSVGFLTVRVLIRLWKIFRDDTSWCATKRWWQPWKKGCPSILSCRFQQHQNGSQGFWYGSLVLNGYRLARLTSFSGEKALRGVKRRDQWIPWKEGIVDDTPLPNGFHYIGQSDHNRAEHKTNIKNSNMGSQLVRQLSECNDYFPEWHTPVVLDFDKDAEKKIIERLLVHMWGIVGVIDR